MDLGRTTYEPEKTDRFINRVKIVNCKMDDDVREIIEATLESNIAAHGGVEGILDYYKLPVEGAIVEIKGVSYSWTVEAKETNKVEYNENSRFCVLCDAGAGVEAKEGSGGQRFIVYCSLSCPTFEITKRAANEIQRKLNEKAGLIKMIKALTKKTHNDMPVIRMAKESQTLIVTTRSDEADEQEE